MAKKKNKIYPRIRRKEDNQVQKRLADIAVRTHLIQLRRVRAVGRVVGQRCSLHLLLLKMAIIVVAAAVVVIVAVVVVGMVRLLLLLLRRVESSFFVLRVLG